MLKKKASEFAVLRLPRFRTAITMNLRGTHVETAGTSYAQPESQMSDAAVHRRFILKAQWMLCEKVETVERDEASVRET